MAISANYSQAVTVNGFTCRNCTDVSFAQKHVDPQHPASGPYNLSAASDASRSPTDPVKIEAVRRAAEQSRTRTSGYAADGSGRAGLAQNGQALSLLA